MSYRPIVRLHSGPNVTALVVEEVRAWTVEAARGEVRPVQHASNVATLVFIRDLAYPFRIEGDHSATLELAVSGMRAVVAS